MRFSIIIPCYNVEPYLDECMRSIVDQSYTDFEAILIDDGSTDGTHEKCERWCAADQRLHLITKNNGGLSSARNAGIDVARGDYLVFVDSDDTIEKDSLLHFDRALNGDEDVLITRLAESYPDRFLEHDQALTQMNGKELNQREAIDWIMNHSECTWPSVKNIVSRRLVQEHSLRFQKEILNEDIEWTAHLFCIARKYCCCDYLWYHHRRQRPGSISLLISRRQITDVIDIAYAYIDGERKEAMDRLEPDCRRWIELRLMRSVYACLSYYKAMDREDREYTVQHIQNKLSIFRYAPYVRHRFFRDVMRVCGVRTAMALYAVFT